MSHSPTAIARSPQKTIAIDISGSPHTSPQQKGNNGGVNDGSSSPLLKSHAPPSFEIESGNGGASSSSASSSSSSSNSLSARFLRVLKAKLVTPMINILKSGATPEGIALSLAFGITGGLFPVPATTTLICLLFVFLFKLNIAAVQVSNLLMTPLNLGTFMIFIRFGEKIFGAEPVALSLEPFQSDPLNALATFWISLCYGVVAWMIFTPPATFLLYLILKPIMRKAMANFNTSSKPSLD